MDPPATPAWPDSKRDLTLQYKVHLGVWTDWSRGRLLGTILTLDRQQANLLIAFTASFVVFVGSRFWRVVCLFFHQVYSTSDPRDALHHQRQVVLRNSGSSDSGVFKLITMLHAWRGSSFKSTMRIIPVLLLAMVCTVGFTVAGGYSSKIELGSDNIGSAVLLDGANCGVIGNITSEGEQIAYEKLVASLTGAANNYVQQCYSANSTGLTDCNYFISRRLPGFIDSAAPCPFNSSICRSNSNNLALDTGLLDTDAHFGLNAPSDERLFIRHRLECAPLLTEGHASVHGNYTRYNYGPHWTEFGTESASSLGLLNYTYEVESLDDQYTFKDGDTMIEQSYMLRSMFADTLNGTPAGDPSSSFIPSVELERTDADIFLVFLSGHGVYFSEPLNDSWYRATEPFAAMRNLVDEGSIPVYRTSEPASPLGCASQWQFCNTNKTTCGPLASYHDAMTGTKGVFGVDEDASAGKLSPARERLRWLRAALGIQYTGEDSILRNLQDSALLSRQSLFQGYQGPLPDNQWQLDVTNWFSIYLAFMQSNLLLTASGTMGVASGINVAEPTTEVALSLCSNQKIRTTRYSSFSFIGLLLTYILGGLVLITSYSLEPILACLHRRLRYKQYAYLEWTTNETLQLHRVAHENPNEVDSTWSRCTSWVPTTAAGVLLSSLDISDLKHPRLPSKGQDDTISRLDAIESEPATPEDVVSAGSNPEPSCSSPQHLEMTHEVVIADAELPQVYVPQMTAVATSPDAEDQGAQISISTHEIEPPSLVEEIPCQHYPGGTTQIKPHQMPETHHGRMSSPHVFPTISTETGKRFVNGGDGAMGNFI